MTRTLVTLGLLIVLALLPQPRVVLAQSITARGEILPVRAEPRGISNTIPFTQVFERRRQTLPEEQEEVRKQQRERERRLEEQIERMITQARTRAQARARNLEAALEEKYRALQKIQVDPTRYRFKDWASSNDAVIFTVRQLIDRTGLGQYEVLLLDLLENAVLKYTWRLERLSRGEPLTPYQANPEDDSETQTAEDMVPGVIQRMQDLETAYGGQPLQTQIAILQGLHGRLKAEKMVETIEGVLDSVQRLIDARRQRRDRVTH